MEKPYINIIVYCRNINSIESKLIELVREYNGAPNIGVFRLTGLLDFEFHFDNLEDAYAFACRARLYDAVEKVEGYCEI